MSCYSSDTPSRKVNEYAKNSGKQNNKSTMSDYSSTASNSPYKSAYYVPDQLQMNVNQSPVQNFNQMPNNIQILNQNYCPMPQPDLNYKPPNPNPKINFQNNLINESLDAVFKQMLESYLLVNNQQIPGQVVPKQQQNVSSSHHDHIHPTHHRHQEDLTKVKKNHYVNAPHAQYNKQVQQQQEQKPKPLQESEPKKQWKHFDTIYDGLHSPEDEEPQKQWKHFNTIYNDLQSNK